MEENLAKRNPTYPPLQGREMEEIEAKIVLYN